MNPDSKKRAIVLLSGGMDSSTCLAMAISRGFACYSMAFDYGQRHRFELEMARRQAARLGASDHRVLRVDLASLGGSALTGDCRVPKVDPRDQIPVTYVPARNTVFLSLALALAEVLGAHDIFIGANQVDYSGYPDCRRPFIEAFEKMANLATCMGTEGHSIRIQAPLLDLDKAQIIRSGMDLGVDYSVTHTCYDPGLEGEACGLCPACRLRLKGFKDAGLKDPLRYKDLS